MRSSIPLLVLALLLISSGPIHSVEPPSQPESGPGGNDYVHQRVRTTHVFTGRVRYRIYEPSWPRPESAPVLVYFGGIAGAGPYLGAGEFSLFARAYDRMFRHLARKGTIVVFPAYGPVGASPAAYEHHAIRATTHALRRLEGPLHVSPRRDRFALAGHSFGGLLASVVATRYAAYGLPRPRAVIAHEPSLASQLRSACAADAAHPFCGLDLPDDFAGIPADAARVTVVGGEHRLHRIEDTLAEWDVAHLPLSRKALLFLHADDNGPASLTPTHMSPGADPLLPLDGFELDAIDWYGYWKPTEATLDFVFHGYHGEFVFGDGAAARSMGHWSDGTPVRRMSTASDFR